MNIAQPHFLFAFLFLLIPLILHFLKKSQARVIPFSSLNFLLKQNSQLSRQLKLKQVLLLLVRLAIVLALALFFVKPLLMNSPAWLKSVLPYQSEGVIFLDTRFDTKEGILESLPHLKNSRITEFQSQPGKSYLEILKTAGLNPGKAPLVISRFYGITQEDWQKLLASGVELLPTGPDKEENISIESLFLDPPNPFRQEKVKAEISVFSNAPSKTLTLSLWGNETLLYSAPFTCQSGDFCQQKIQLQIPSQDRFDLKASLGLSTRTLTIRPRTSFRIALVSDTVSASRRDSRLFFIHQFLKGLEEIYGQNIHFEIACLNSSEWKKSNKTGWDWLILGDIFEKQDPYEGKTLCFYQKETPHRHLLENSTEMSFFSFVQGRSEIQFQNLVESDRLMLNRPFHVLSHLQTRMQNGLPLISGGNETFLWQKSNFLFSAFDFTPLGWDAVDHPYFPVFLYRLFLSRDQKAPPLDYQSVQARFTRPPFVIQAKMQDSQILNADLSALALLFFLLFLGLEAGLIFSIKKQLQSN